MSDSVKALMYAAVGALIFCAAISVFMMLVRNVDSLADNVRDTSSYDTSLAKEGRVEPEEPEITYADVMAELMTDKLEYDLKIDGVLIEKDTYNLYMRENYTFNFSPHYVRNCVYDDNGYLKEVDYWGIP
ncbi:MAG: hypothetical protein IKS98_08795 [Lachnospiraceae bacterium]|nr:hypothetical protein [Lachnospiraceae bacterium]